LVPVELAAAPQLWVNGDKMEQRQPFLATTHFQPLLRLVDPVDAGRRTQIQEAHLEMDSFQAWAAGAGPVTGPLVVGAVAVVPEVQATDKMQMLVTTTELVMEDLAQAPASSTQLLHPA
jgi:hypothetical protein